MAGRIQDGIAAAGQAQRVTAGELGTRTASLVYGNHHRVVLQRFGQAAAVGEDDQLGAVALRARAPRTRGGRMRTRAGGRTEPLPRAAGFRPMSAGDAAHTRITSLRAQTSTGQPSSATVDARIALVWRR